MRKTNVFIVHGERPCDRMKLEELRPLPRPHRWLPFLRETRQMSQDGFVSYDGIHYGIPWYYSGREATIWEREGKAQLWIGGVNCLPQESFPLQG
jgi:hypothetical protein